MMAWRQAGVSLPHSSASQFNVGRRISASELQPGDLIFYYSPISHVSIYIGGGQRISATHTGDYVRVQSLGSSIVGYAAQRLARFPQTKPAEPGSSVCRGRDRDADSALVSAVRSSHGQARDRSARGRHGVGVQQFGRTTLRPRTRGLRVLAYSSWSCRGGAPARARPRPAVRHPLHRPGCRLPGHGSGRGAPPASDGPAPSRSGKAEAWRWSSRAMDEGRPGMPMTVSSRGPRGKARCAQGRGVRTAWFSGSGHGSSSRALPHTLVRCPVPPLTVSGTSVGMFAIVVYLAAVAGRGGPVRLRGGRPDRRSGDGVTCPAPLDGQPPLVQIRPVEARWPTAVPRLRRAPAGRAARIAPALERVCRRAGTILWPYLLGSRRAAVNAFALGGTAGRDPGWRAELRKCWSGAGH